MILPGAGADDCWTVQNSRFSLDYLRTCSLSSVLPGFAYYKIPSYPYNLTRQEFLSTLCRYGSQCPEQESVDSSLGLVHHDCGVATFGFTANCTPELPRLRSSAQPGLALLTGEITFMVKCYPAQCHLASLAALAGQCYFWLIYIFPYVSKGGRIAPIKFYVCFLQMGSTVDISKDLRTKIVILFTELSAPSCPHPSPPLSWHKYSDMGRTLSSHLRVKNASAHLTPSSEQLMAITGILATLSSL